MKKFTEFMQDDRKIIVLIVIAALAIRIPLFNLVTTENAQDGYWVMTVAKRMPKPSDTAMGMRNLACREVSNIMGAKPPKVVRVVKRIGRKR